MKRTIAIIAAAIVLAVLLPRAAEAATVTSNISVAVFCYNTTLNLTTDKLTYQYNEVANMTVLINNSQNRENLSEVLIIEFYNSAGTMVKYMAKDSAVAPGNGTNTTSYNGAFTGLSAGNYTLRARIIANFAYPSQNVTAHDCSVESPAVLSDVNITVTQLIPNPPGNLMLLLDKVPGPNYQDVTLNWTLSNSTNIFNYVIYKTDNWAAGFNYSDPYMTVGNDATNWTDPTSDGADQRYYVVRANNTNGLTDENTYAVGKFNLHLYTGWNLVSLPLLVWNETMNDIFYTREDGDLSNRWVATVPTFQRTDYYLGFGWFGDYDTMQPDRGYWYRSQKNGYTTTPFNNTIVGVVPTTQRSEAIYNKRWSMLGWTSVNVKGMGTAFGNPSDYDLVNLYYAPGHTFKRTDYYLGFGWFGDFSTMNPGTGYWYYSQNAMQYSWDYQP